jgi:hypothetical protein
MHKNETEMKSGPMEIIKECTCTKQDTNDWKQMTVYVYGTETCKQKQWTFSGTGNCLS